MTTLPAAQKLGAEFEPGYELGPYSLLERLGYGGQAVVWSAWNQRRRRVVAVKFIAGRSASSQGDPGVYLRELQIASGLEHPNVLPIYDIGVSDRFDYLVMRYVCHGSLEDHLRAGPFPPPEALPLVTQIAAALEYIHARGIVHRDLKPRNILLDSQRRAFLADFGLARPLSGTTRPLHTGQGTAPYSPPEQHTRSQVTYASDIYSLGVMLYEVLTGQLPWDGQTALAIRQLDSSEELPDPRNVNPALPRALAPALRKLTARHPANRPPSVKHALIMVARALQEDQLLGVEASLSLESLVEASSARLDDDAWTADDALFLVKRALTDWDPQAERLALSHTDFMLVDGIYPYAERHGRAFNDAQLQLMLRGALTYGHNLTFWLDKVRDPQTRVLICEQTIANENEAAATRALGLISAEPTVPPRSTNAFEALINLSVEATEPRLRIDALTALQQAGRANTTWRAVGFSEAGDGKLAALAVSDGAQAAQAARLIGQVHSEAAIHAILDAHKGAAASRVMDALMEVREAAGSLPESIPAFLRFQVGVELGRRQLLEDPAMLAKAYLVAALGSALGLGLHVYVTYRLPSFLDRARILNAVGSGLLFGALIGLGVFLTRLMVCRLRLLPSPLRTVLGIIIGALMINLGIVSYHNLFLDAVPVGWLVALGAGLIALGFGVAEALSRSRLLRILLSGTATALGLGLTWVLALRTGFSPVVYYEMEQPQATALLAVATALLMAGIAQVVDLRENQEPA